jgi:hypothetical protein
MTMSAAEVRALREKNKKEKGSGKKWLKIEGDTVLYIRIGPPWKRDKDGEWGEIWKDAYYHAKYPNKLYCPTGTIDPKTKQPRFCPVCKRLKELKNDRSAFGKRLYKILVRKHEGLWNAMKLKTKQTDDGDIKIVGRDGGWQVMRLSGSWHNELLDLFTETEYRKQSIFGVADLKYGRVVRIRRTGSGLNDTEYRFKAFTSPSLAAPTKEDRIALRKALINLDEVVEFGSKEELESFLRRSEKKAKSVDAEPGEVDTDTEEEQNGRPKGKRHEALDGEEEDTEEAEGESEDSEGEYGGGGEEGEEAVSDDDEGLPADDDGSGGLEEETIDEDADEQILSEMKRKTQGKKPQHEYEE